MGTAASAPLRLMRRAMTRQRSVVPAATSASASAGKVRPANASNAKVAARYLRNEGVIAVPTDTIYGLAAHAGRDGGVKRLWEIKGRPSDLPIGIAVHEVAAIGKYARVEHVPDGLLEALLPGPVTVVLPRHEESALAPSLNPGRTNVGVRVPEDDFLRAALDDLQAAIALTSANRSGATSTLAVSEFEDLWPSLDAVFDGGAIESGRAGSTIVDLSNAKSDGAPWTFRVLRDGSALTPTVDTVRQFGGTQVT